MTVDVETTPATSADAALDIPHRELLEMTSRLPTASSGGSMSGLPAG
jgi:hypothetical protein